MKSRFIIQLTKMWGWQIEYLKTEFVLRGVRIWKVIIMLLIYVGNILKDIILWEYLAHLQ